MRSSTPPFPKDSANKFGPYAQLQCWRSRTMCPLGLAETSPQVPSLSPSLSSCVYPFSFSAWSSSAFSLYAASACGTLTRRILTDYSGTSSASNFFGHWPSGAHTRFCNVTSVGSIIFTNGNAQDFTNAPDDGVSRGDGGRHGGGGVDVPPTCNFVLVSCLRWGVFKIVRTRQVMGTCLKEGRTGRDRLFDGSTPGGLGRGFEDAGGMARRDGDTSGLGRGFGCTSGQGLDGRGFDGSSGLMVGQCDCNTRLLQKSSSLVNSKGITPLRDSPVSSFPCALGCSAAPAPSSHSAPALSSPGNLEESRRGTLDKAADRGGS